MRGFGDARFLVLVTLIAGACAKANDSMLGGASLPSTGGSGGSSAKGGTGGSSAASTGGSSATGTGGTSAKGGTSGGSGKGGNNAFGGSATTGGTSGNTGSGGSTGGAGGAGGTTGGSGGATGGTAGSAGDDGIPDDVLKNAKVVIHYKVTKAGATSQQIEMKLFVENKATAALDAKNLTVRYWMTPEFAPAMLTSYYQGDDLKNQAVLTFVEDGDDSYVEASFKGGSIPPGEQLYKTEFQIYADTGQGSKLFDQANDWSFDPTLTTDAPNALANDKITAYVGTKLVWGCEPSLRCPDTGEGGAGGESGGGGDAGLGGQAGH